jgi:hypothetical protein
MMQTKELDMLIIHVGMELKLHKTLCLFLVAQLQDLEPNVSRKRLIQGNWVDSKKIKMGSNNNQGLVHVIKAIEEDN